VDHCVYVYVWVYVWAVAPLPILGRPGFAG
jgi:hypothetical protein